MELQKRHKARDVRYVVPAGPVCWPGHARRFVAKSFYDFELEAITKAGKMTDTAIEALIEGLRRKRVL
jgi:hypothetical protein